MRKILVLRGGALGDFIVTLPALALLRQRWPDAQIELAGNRPAAQLAVTRGLLNAVHSQHEGRWAGLFSAGTLEPGFARWLESFDLILNYWPDPDGTLARHFPQRSSQKFITAPALPDQSPAAAHYCAPLATLGLRPDTFFHRLAVSPELENASLPDPPTQKAIILHPGSGSPLKNWPDDRWLALIESLAKPIALVLGEAERDRWSRHGLPPSVQPLQDRSLEELVMRFAASCLFVGHDSGISHLAAASGARCLLLFGPTDPARWAPPTPNVRILQRGPQLSALSVDDVRQAILAELPE